MSIAIDRSKAPGVKQAPVFDLDCFEEFKLQNGIPVFALHGKDLQLLRIDLVFNAGRSFEEKKMLSAFCARMLREGTDKMNGNDIAEQLDYYGASLSIESALEYTTVKIITLPRFLRPVLEIIADILSIPSFPEKDLKRIIKISKQKLRINQEKSDYIASNLFSDVLFGPDHPYGYSPKLTDYDNFSTEDLRQHFNSLFYSGNAELFLAGNYSPEHIQIINETIGSKIIARSGIAVSKKIAFLQDPELIHRLKKKDGQQAAIRVGYLTMNKFDPSYNQLRILNVLFGGFFGSRLMSNIREDKGYTYGISSILTSLLQTGYLMISTEVGLEYADDTLKEISNEIERLHNEVPDKTELDMLKNYMLGNLTAQVDGVFKMANVLKDLHIFGLTNADHREYMQTIRDVSPEQIQAFAQKYLNYQKMYKVVVE